MLTDADFIAEYFLRSFFFIFIILPFLIFIISLQLMIGRNGTG